MLKLSIHADIGKPYTSIVTWVSLRSDKKTRSLVTSIELEMVKYIRVCLITAKVSASVPKNCSLKSYLITFAKCWWRLPNRKQMWVRQNVAGICWRPSAIYKTPLSRSLCLHIYWWLVIYPYVPFVSLYLLFWLRLITFKIAKVLCSSDWV